MFMGPLVVQKCPGAGAGWLPHDDEYQNPTRRPRKIPKAMTISKILRIVRGDGDICLYRARKIHTQIGTSAHTSVGMIYFQVKCRSDLYPGFVPDLTENMRRKGLCVKSGYDKILSHVVRGTVLYVRPCLHSPLGQRLYDNYNKRKTMVWDILQMTVELIPIRQPDDDDGDNIDDILRDVECSRRLFEHGAEDCGRPLCRKITIL